MALSLRLPTDCIKTSLSVCIDRCAAARRSQIFQPACCHSGRCKADSGVEVMLLRAQIEAQPLMLRVGLLVLMQSADVCLGSTRCCWLKFLLLTHALGQNKGRPGIQINHRPPPTSYHEICSQCLSANNLQSCRGIRSGLDRSDFTLNAEPFLTFWKAAISCMLHIVITGLHLRMEAFFKILFT